MYVCMCVVCVVCVRRVCVVNSIFWWRLKFYWIPWHFLLNLIVVLLNPFEIILNSFESPLNSSENPTGFYWNSIGISCNSQRSVLKLYWILLKWYRILLKLFWMPMTLYGILVRLHGIILLKLFGVLLKLHWMRSYFSALLLSIQQHSLSMSYWSNSADATVSTFLWKGCESVRMLPGGRGNRARSRTSSPTTRPFVHVEFDYSSFFPP